MTEEKEARRRLSRKDFVKGAALGAAGAAAAGALAGCGPAATPAPTTAPEATATPVPAQECPPCPTPWIPEKWDYEADVVVVGYGGAGGVTAITAHDAGANVLILEKQQPDTPTEVRHTPSTRMCGAVYVHTEDAAKAAEHLYDLSFGATPEDVCQVWGEGTTKVSDWLRGIGLEVGVMNPEAAEFKMIPGSDAIQMWVVEPSHFRPQDVPVAERSYYFCGPYLFKAISEQVDQRGIQVLYQTPGKRLIQNPETKEILGVVAESGGKEITVKAKKAVALTTGGFQWDEEMKLNFLRGYPSYFYSNPGNTGDGIVMGQEVGAALWHMNTISARAIPHEASWPTGVGGGTPTPFFIVNNFGKRWFKERPWASHSAWLEFTDFATHEGEYPAIPAWTISDETARQAGPMVDVRPKGLLPTKLPGTDHFEVQPMMEWSPDNSVEIEKGWILKGDTIEELAANIKAHPENQAWGYPDGRMDPVVLKETLTKYNEYCDAGEDAEFGRDPATLIPVETPPFYAIKLYPGGPNTQGGVKKNAKAQVVDANGQAIPRLYAVGELGSVYGFLYPTGGGNVAEFVIFGQVAGENAAKEESWE